MFPILIIKIQQKCGIENKTDSAKQPGGLGRAHFAANQETQDEDQMLILHARRFGVYSRSIYSICHMLSIEEGQGGEGVSLFFLLPVNGANSWNSLNDYSIWSSVSDGKRRKGNFAY